jgi:hypothetical protein
MERRNREGVPPVEYLKPLSKYLIPNILAAPLYAKRAPMSTIISGFGTIQIDYDFLNDPSGPEILAKPNITRTRKSRPFHNLRRYSL